MVETIRNRHGTAQSVIAEPEQIAPRNLGQDLRMERLRARLEDSQTSIVRDIDNRLTSMVEQVIDEIKKSNSVAAQFNKLFSESKSEEDIRRKPSKNGALPSKEFIARNSLLTDLIEVKHIRAIYHIHIVAVIIMFLNCFIHDFVDSGRINLGINPVIKGFAGFKVGLLIWIAMKIVSLLVFPTFKLWANFKQLVPRDLKKSFDYLSSFAVLLYILSFGYVFTYSIKALHLGPASTIALLLELTRFLMKTYAFIRSNAPKASLTKSSSDDKPRLVLPTFNHYIYFLFCPTMVYRDSYPRTKQIRWKFVFMCYAELFGVILYMSFLFERYVIPVFQKVGATQINSSEFVLQIFGCMMPAILIFLSGFYLLLHSWMNAAAEMLRFADRQFYTDWWNATSFPEYYRRWNVVVHDWLYEYVYKDSYELIFKRNKTAAMILVFTISSFVHEYILAFSFGFFYPVMLVLFQGCGIIVMFIPNKNRNNLGNIFMWFGIITGNALMLGLYNMEYHARLNCPVGDSIMDYFIPISWHCNGISTKPDWKVQF